MGFVYILYSLFYKNNNIIVHDILTKIIMKKITNKEQMKPYVSLFLRLFFIIIG